MMQEWLGNWSGSLRYSLGTTVMFEFVPLIVVASIGTALGQWL